MEVSESAAPMQLQSVPEQIRIRLDDLTVKNIGDTIRDVEVSASREGPLLGASHELPAAFVGLVDAACEHTQEASGSAPPSLANRLEKEQKPTSATTCCQAR
jgi:hypothetical protein